MFAPYADLIAHWPIWLAVTLLLGGPAAYASGRALALNWRAFGIGIAYAGVLAAVSSFLAYALFGTSVIPAWAIAARVAAFDALGAAALLAGWAASFLLLVVISFIGWHFTRAGQMQRQYPFLYPP
jgi:hypothetical protein